MFGKFELFWAKKRWARNNPRIQTCSITSLNEIGTRKRSPLYSSFKDQPKLYGWDDGRNGELFLKKKKEIASCGLWYCIYAIRAFLTDSFADLTIQTPSRNLQENFYKRTKGGAYVCTWAYGLVSLTKLWLRWTYTYSTCHTPGQHMFQALSTTKPVTLNRRNDKLPRGRVSAPPK